MEILSVTLKNFKTHSDRHFQFQPGTNAICGENGAGKTSILEAIAWTLFNYRGSYRKEDFIRNGCRSAQATISFVSNRDQRTYNVQRCTSKGYTLFDPQLNQRLPYNRIEDEILPWLREHLGVTAGTDLPRLFENTIGVPQGMLTADFLLSGEKRRRVFDAILKVEEYKQTATGLGTLQKYSEGQVAGIERDLKHYGEVLENQPEVEAKHSALTQDIQASEHHLATLQQEFAQLTQQKAAWDAQAQTVKELEQTLHTLSTQLEGRQREQKLWADAVTRSQQAVEICTEHRPGYDQYVKSEVTLKALQEDRHAQTQLLQKQQGFEQQGAKLDRELATINERIRQIEQAEDRIQHLMPLIDQQETLEQEKQALERALVQRQQWIAEKDAAEKQLRRLRTDWKELSQVIKQITAYEAEIATIPTLEQQRDRIQSQISRVEVAKQFEAELNELVIQLEQENDQQAQHVQGAIAHLQKLRSTIQDPHQATLDEALALLDSGSALPSQGRQRLRQILADVSSQLTIHDLQAQQQSLSQRLQTLYQQKGEWTVLPARQQQLSSIQQEGEETQTHIDHITHQLDEQGDSQSALMAVANELKTLADPRQQQQLLRKEVAQKAALMEQQADLLHQQQTGQAVREQLRHQLAEFTHLDSKIQQQQAIQTTSHASYLTVLQHQQGAEQLAHNQQALQKIEDAIASLSSQKASIQQNYDAAMAQYDLKAAQATEDRYQTVRSEVDHIQGRLPQQTLQLNELKKRLEQFKETIAKRDRAAAELTEKQDAQDFIAFARNVYKQAGPRITERYVQAISSEADRLFRELMNRQNVALEWTRDYEIIVQEGPHPRRFINLSGGEQMCAALAVRLALLRVLADIDIAFFDEPTTNMDKARRESLAEAIANLRTFRQLFVISHDDTFEQFTEHVVLVQRES